MQSIELNVKSIEDAKVEAAERFGVSPEDITVTVLEESKKLFGKVSYKVKAETAKSAPVAEEANTEPKKVTKAESEAKPAAKKLGSKKKEEAPAEASAEVAVEEAKPVAKKLGKKKETTPAAEATAEAPVVESGDESNEPEIVATEEDAKKLADILAVLSKKTGLLAEIQVGELQGKYINLSIDGKEAGFLVGKNGEVLNSLQYLINLIVKQQMGNGVRVTLDGNDYRKRRAEALTNLAVKIAEKVIERGEEAVLEALPAFERRVIHKVLQEIEGVTTYSEGEEPDRRVVIAPLD
ncbi:MAG: RNA-binding cell elongation regulator Jag/EloR [Fimbriimonas sp.]|jgi:spoIIIJ-associated protein|nr:KH domain-containing protein [Fimbriimonadaceae bacterium]